MTMNTEVHILSRHTCDSVVQLSLFQVLKMRLKEFFLIHQALKTKSDILKCRALVTNY